MLEKNKQKKVQEKTKNKSERKNDWFRPDFRAVQCIQFSFNELVTWLPLDYFWLLPIKKFDNYEHLKSWKINS